MSLYINNLKLKLLLLNRYFEIKYKYNTYFTTIILIFQINLLLFDACNNINDV